MIDLKTDIQNKNTMIPTYMTILKRSFLFNKSTTPAENKNSPIQQFLKAQNGQLSLDPSCFIVLKGR